MLFKIFIVITLSKAVVNYESRGNLLEIYFQDGNSYYGQKFPQKYLSVDETKPTSADMYRYVGAIYRVLEYFSEDPNDTDSNVAISSFLMKAVIKRIILDYGEKIKDEEKGLLKSIISIADNLLSHYNYFYGNYNQKEENHIGHQMAKLFQHDDSITHTIDKIHSNSIQYWIKSKVKLNDYIEQMDDNTLPREQYVHFIEYNDDYYPMEESDKCLSTISEKHLPLKKDDKFKPCLPDIQCTSKVFGLPNVAYSLSHRMLYLLLIRITRRCYVISEKADKMHLDIMCANMYRETVYLARKGHFFRDIFMEHIALCSMLGYSEFHRRNWFLKTASWIDNDGCIKENYNFMFNRSTIQVSRAKNLKEVKYLKKVKRLYLSDECYHHQMALSLIVMAHGIRYTVHHRGHAGSQLNYNKTD